MQRGFITMAYGDKYCKLAEHLYMSYKLFGNCEYPFYVITDKISATRLGKTFDGVIIKDNFVKSTVDKLFFFLDNPFEESVFIDSDCSIVSDINYVFDEFQKNGSPISAVSDYRNLSNPEKGIQFGKNAISEFKITKDFPNFNGGVYYYKKCDLANQCISFIFDILIPNYVHYGMRTRDKGTYADEPPVVVGMLRFGFIPIPCKRGIMYLVHNNIPVKWNMKRRLCAFNWYEYTVHPTIIHWTVGGTETIQFEKYDARIRNKFYHYPKIKLWIQLLLCDIKYYVYPYVLKIFPQMHTLIERVKK